MRVRGSEQRSEAMSRGWTRGEFAAPRRTGGRVDVSESWSAGVPSGSSGSRPRMAASRPGCGRVDDDRVAGTPREAKLGAGERALTRRRMRRRGAGHGCGGAINTHASHANAAAMKPRGCASIALHGLQCNAGARATGQSRVTPGLTSLREWVKNKEGESTRSRSSPGLVGFALPNRPAVRSILAILIVVRLLLGSADLSRTSRATTRRLASAPLQGRSRAFEAPADEATSPTVLATLQTAPSPVVSRDKGDDPPGRGVCGIAIPAARSDFEIGDAAPA